MSATVQRILVTGANGNLGRKIIGALLATSWCESVVGLDREFSPGGLPDDPRLATLTADLVDRGGAWRDSIEYVDGIVHLAAQNPYPDASWADCVASVDMTFNLIEAAAAATGTKRIVFASSNHVMGGYKETPLATTPGALTPELEPKPGTRYMVAGRYLDVPAYAVAKLMGERALLAHARPAGLTGVSLRIGWCQPGENDPSTISASGIPGGDGDTTDPVVAHDLRWFRQMWLSNRDYSGVVEAALRADATRWPTPAIVVNAMSANSGAPWDLGPTRTLIGYAPKDDVWPALGMAPPA